MNVNVYQKNKFIAFSFLLMYLISMNMKQFLNQASPDGREVLAMTIGTTVAYLYQIAGGHSRPGALLCRQIETATHGLVTAEELRPDIFKKK